MRNIITNIIYLIPFILLLLIALVIYIIVACCDSLQTYEAIDEAIEDEYEYYQIHGW